MPVAAWRADTHQPNDRTSPSGLRLSAPSSSLCPCHVGSRLLRPTSSWPTGSEDEAVVLLVAVVVLRLLLRVTTVMIRQAQQTSARSWLRTA